MKRHFFIKFCAQFMTCFFSRFHLKSIFDTISWRTESCMHKCISSCAIFNKPKFNCLKYMIYLLNLLDSVQMDVLIIFLLWLKYVSPYNMNLFSPYQWYHEEVNMSQALLYTSLTTPSMNILNNHGDITHPCHRIGPFSPHTALSSARRNQ